ncbi:hypothetical protein OW763_13695 [Clostridium aestuarii]|uniref:Uncharacterized protein n=1 Tax=Clostridium aestuarii TaxID=338193 RepID=A0ABT4D2A8_9CLOT|nr:hypothetical protein [Clostridium aestuarii]MCY6485385.1 hypothetical protein [Clostridium aestuarii]
MMNILSVAIILFILLEASNVIILYFKPDSKLGNGVAVFNAWETSKKDTEMHEFVKYLVYWVAGTKLIFIALLIVILLTASETTKLLSVIALILSIASFYWRLFPIIRELDKKGQITPLGYSKTLGIMIGGFITIFCLSLLLEFIL